MSMTEELELGSHQHPHPYGASHLSITHKFGFAVYSLDQQSLDDIHDALHDNPALIGQWLDAEACWNHEQELVELTRLRSNTDEWLQDHPEYEADPETPLLPGQRAW